MRELKKKYLIILALAVFDLIVLLATFILKYVIFFNLLLLNIIFFIMLFTVIIPIWYLQLIQKQPITPKEYYMTMIKKEYRHLDKDLLTKMFEMRITNLRNFIFAYLAFLATFTLAIAFNLEKVRQYSHNPYFPELCVLTGIIGIMVFVYYSFRLDRETIRELKELFKAIKKLDQLKKESDDESADSIAKSRTHD